MEDAARRYLAGEPLDKIARGMRGKGKGGSLSRFTLWHTLRDRCGDTWVQTFDSDSLNIHERIETKVPRLLPDHTISRIRKKMNAVRQRSCLHKTGRNSPAYLLSGRIFCGVCGYALFGQTQGGPDYSGRGSRPRRYYRHSSHDGAKECPARKGCWVPADKVEQEVLTQLFDMLGNPAAILRAVQAAVPDCDGLLKRKGRLEADLAKVNKQRGNIVDAIADGTITREDAREKLARMAEDEERLRADLDRLTEALADVPGEDELRVYLGRYTDRDGRLCIFTTIRAARTTPAATAWEPGST